MKKIRKGFVKEVISENWVQMVLYMVAAPLGMLAALLILGYS